MSEFEGRRGISMLALISGLIFSLSSCAAQDADSARYTAEILEVVSFEDADGSKNISFIVTHPEGGSRIVVTDPICENLHLQAGDRLVYLAVKSRVDERKFITFLAVKDNKEP